MEHRRGYRLPATFPVSIYNNHISLGHFDARDISAGGLCITDTGNHLSKGNFVNVQLNFDDTNQPDCCYMKAIVVYRDDISVGLMWAAYDPNFTYCLQKLASVAA